MASGTSDQNAGDVISTTHPSRLVDQRSASGGGSGRIDNQVGNSVFLHMSCQTIRAQQKDIVWTDVEDRYFRSDCLLYSDSSGNYILHIRLLSLIPRNEALPNVIHDERMVVCKLLDAAV